MKLSWFILSLIALSSLSIMSLLITTLTRKGYPVSFVLLAIGIIWSIFYFLQTYIFSSHTFTVNLNTVLVLILIGIFSTIGNLALFQAANNAPNAGLAIAVGAGLQAAVISILAFFFLKDNLTSLQMVGLALAVVSIFIISLGSAHS